MLKKIFITLLVLVAIFVVTVAFFGPKDYRVVRTTNIAAPSSVVFSQINDLHRWETWSPWAKLDPAMKITYSGPAAGPRASYHWVGNKQVGEGTMTISDSHSADAVKLQLEFLKPFKSSSMVQFDLKGEGGQTNVSWSMSGENNFVSKAMGLFMSMDKMIGPDFEKGLAQLKTVFGIGGEIISSFP